MSVVEYLWDTWSTVALQLQLTKDGFGKQLVERAGLSSFSPFDLMLAVGFLFIVYIIYRKVKDASREKERFLEVYPQMKRELEERITKLHALADKIDKVHRRYTITQVVANSTGAVSGVMTILNFALAPLAAGVRLGLSATGTASVEAEASQFLPRSNDSENDIKSNETKDITESLKKITTRLVSVSKKIVKTMDDIKKNMDANKLTKENPHLKNNAKRLMTTGRLSAKSTKEVKKAFRGTVLTMTKKDRIMEAATASRYLALDIISIIKDTKHLQEGAKVESAEKLRQKAKDLEQKLQELIQAYDILTQ